MKVRKFCSNVNNSKKLNVMTSSRVVRGTKSKIFFCVCAVIIVTGIFACYNNTLSQLEDVRKSNNQCHQQQENLSTQLQGKTPCFTVASFH